MLTLPQTIATVSGAFAPMFSQRVFEHATLPVVGAILAPGKRTVTAALRVMGSSHDRHFQHDHHVLHRARWSARRGGRMLLPWLLGVFAPTGPLVIGIDETLARRRGERMAAKGMYRDPVRSSQAHVVNARGWRWVCLMRLALVPWTTRVWGWPCLTGLSPSERDSQPRGRVPRTLLDRARHAVWRVRRWLPARELVVGGDHTYAALAWLEAVRHAVCVITRMRLEATLDDPAPPRQPRQNGRPRKKGTRLPTHENVLTASTTRWRTVTVAHRDGEGARRVQIASQTAVWDHAGQLVVPLRWVLMRDPAGRLAPQALLATTSQLRPVQLLPSVVRRGQMETTCEEVRAHLGVETQRPLRDQATARTTPAVLAPYAMVTLMAAQLLGTHPLPVREAAWYRQAHATLSDTIALVRRCVWRQCHCSPSQAEADMGNIPRLLSEHSTDALCYAA